VLLDDRFDSVLFAEVLLTNVVELQPGFGRQRFRIRFDGLGERLHELHEIEDSRAPRRQVLGHPVGAAQRRQRADDDHAVKASQYSGDLVGVTLADSCHASASLIPAPLGSGSSGLGIDHSKLTVQYQGRHFRLTDVHGDVLTPLLS